MSQFVGCLIEIAANEGWREELTTLQAVELLWKRQAKRVKKKRYAKQVLTELAAEERYATMPDLDTVKTIVRSADRQTLFTRNSIFGK